MTDVIFDTLIDTIKLLPFLFVTYLFMDIIENRISATSRVSVSKAGKFGPIIGGILGAVPQCGFSAAASYLYAARIISVGTLLSIYLSTSDEMLPMMISNLGTNGNKVTVILILKILVLKIIIGMLAGFFVDLVFSKIGGQYSAGPQEEYPEETDDTDDVLQMQEETEGEEIDPATVGTCTEEGCDCGEYNIYAYALYRSLYLMVFVAIVTFILNTIVYFIGSDTLSNLLINKPVIGEIAAGIFGLIPNCTGSIIITQLYLEGVISAGAMMAGLLVGAGVGLLVLFRVNVNQKENIKILVWLYLIGVIVGTIIEMLGVAI